MRSELCGVDEDGDDEMRVSLCGGGDEREVSSVEGAHGWDEGNGGGGEGCLSAKGAERREGGEHGNGGSGHGGGGDQVEGCRYRGRRSYRMLENGRWIAK